MTIEETLAEFEKDVDLLKEKNFKEIQVGIKYEFLTAYKSGSLIIGIYREKEEPKEE